MYSPFTHVCAGFALLLSLSAASADEPAPKDVPPQNLKVVQFCQANKSKKVGDGECYALAATALQSAKSRRFRPYGLDADYVWGTLIATVLPDKEYAGDKIRPGDILQMRNAQFPGALLKQHTAVVVGVTDDGRAVSVLEQNAGNGTEEEKRTVKPGEYLLGKLKGGWVKVYRPVLLPDPEKDKAPDAFAMGLLRLLNAERKKRELAPLTFNGRLSAASLALAKRAADGQTIEPEELLDLTQDAGYIEKTARYATVTGGSSPEEVLRLWLRLPVVAEIILSADFTEVGISSGVANKQGLRVRVAVCASPAVIP